MDIFKSLKNLFSKKVDNRNVMFPGNLLLCECGKTECTCGNTGCGCGKTKCDCQGKCGCGGGTCTCFVESTKGR